MEIYLYGKIRIGTEGVKSLQKIHIKGGRELFRQRKHVVREEGRYVVTEDTY